MTSHEKTTKIAEETKEAIGAGKKVKSEVKKSKKSEIDNKAALIIFFIILVSSYYTKYCIVILNIINKYKL